MTTTRQVLILLIGLLPAGGFTVQAAENPGSIKVDNQHVHNWNNFANNLLVLHQQLVKQHPLIIKTKTGGYADQPEFYTEESFYHKETGKLISRVQWEKANPDRMHTIEVYVYDDKNRVIRDYSAAYLPTYRNAPTQTLINLHAYNGETHAFRSFDATGDHILDRCTGNYKGEEINILLDEDELYAELDGMRLEPYYKHCVKGLPVRAEKYRTPH
ncbi:MAG: hypothetical protein OEZ39_02815 [Gammaproteobacteria bacterium]|nr:hypothetical protein [Gammaproteobacteria bacterium]MDH5650787.1 hypothetical protein [Gammaproteobacteria bacterium]